MAELYSKADSFLDEQSHAGISRKCSRQEFLETRDGISEEIASREIDELAERIFNLQA